MQNNTEELIDKTTEHLCITCKSGASIERPGTDCTDFTDDMTLDKSQHNIIHCGSYRELPNGQRNITQEWLDREEE